MFASWLQQPRQSIRDYSWFGDIMMKRQIRKALGHSSIPSIVRSTNRSLRVVLYHDIGEPSEYTCNLGVSTPTAIFSEHMTLLGKHYDFVSVDDVISGNLPKRPLLVTFDDAFRSVLDEASPITEALGIRPLLFVATSPVFDGEIVLDNLLSMVESRHPEVLRIFAGDGIAPTANAILREQLPIRTAAERRVLRDEIAARVGSTPTDAARESGIYLKPDDIIRLKARGFDFGTHTHSHVHLRGLEAEEYESEIARPAMLMQELLGQISPTFSFPFGSRHDLTPQTGRYLRSAGMKKVFLVEGLKNRKSNADVICRSSVGSMACSELTAEIEVFAALRRQVVGSLG